MLLGVDFGTSNTVGVLQRPDGAMTSLLFDSSPLLSSAIFAGPDGSVLTGADAQRAALAHPAGLEPNPKRRIDDGSTWLGEREFAVVDLIAAVLAREWAEAHRVSGAVPPNSVVLTHPAAWGHPRLALLGEAARRAGLPPVAFVSEPVAAAAYFATVLGRDIPPGRALVVYDLGAGTFDVSVVRRSIAGFEVVAAAGLADVGGLDLDAVVVDHARSLTAQASAAWGQLDWPESGADQRARRELWDGARAAKELLSRHSHADLRVPLVEADLHLTRQEFEKAARPHLDRTVAATLGLLRSAGVPREATAGIFLVGGSSRIPLVATLLHRQLGIAPTIIDQPELVVAHGCLLYLSVRPTTAVPAPAIAAQFRQPVAQAPMSGAPTAGPRGVLPPEFPVHLVELAVGDRIGYTVRMYAADEGGTKTAIFASENGRLPLFQRPERATEYAAGTDRHALTSVLGWDVLRASMANAFLTLSQEDRYDLDVPAVNLEREPEDWLPPLLISAGQLAIELMYALDIAEGQALIGDGALLDRFDDVLRTVRYGPHRRQGRRELLTFEQADLVDGWYRLADLLESRIDWRD